MRLFVGIPLGQTLTEAVEALQSDLPFGRIVPAENLHVTLAFLDDLTPDMSAQVHAVLEDVRGVPFALELNGVEIRGGRKPRLVWTNADGGAALKSLRAQVRSAVRAAGVALPRERFRPHVTLARFSAAAAAQEAHRLAWFAQDHGLFRAGPEPVTRFCLYRSSLQPDGPVYDELAEYPLR